MEVSCDKILLLNIADFISCTKCSQVNTKIPADIYLLKVHNRNIRKRCEICSKLTIKIPERRQWRRSGIFIVNFEHISHLFSSISIVNFEHVIAGWDSSSVDFHQISEQQTTPNGKYSDHGYLSSAQNSSLPYKPPTKKRKF